VRDGCAEAAALARDPVWTGVREIRANQSVLDWVLVIAPYLRASRQTLVVARTPRDVAVLYSGPPAANSRHKALLVVRGLITVDDARNSYVLPYPYTLEANPADGYVYAHPGYSLLLASTRLLYGNTPSAIVPDKIGSTCVDLVIVYNTAHLVRAKRAALLAFYEARGTQILLLTATSDGGSAATLGKLGPVGGASDSDTE
jgi:hypothetical protein